MDPPPNWESCVGLRVVVAFEDGDESRPMIMGLLDPPPEALEARDYDGERRGKVVRIEGEEELILECGDAKISLRSDGRIVILGGYVVSRSRGVNRIKGGSVQIN
jgi:hypothetical protein